MNRNKMKKNVILIDYENVQKVDFKPLLALDVLIKVFHGENQKFTSDFTNMALEFGKDKFELIKIKGNGKNALDFHIAYYIGKLSKEIENSFFHIISKDTGFKPLVEYLKHNEKIYCLLEPCIAEIPLLKPIPKTNGERFKLVLETLSNSKTSKPKRIKTLKNQIIAICKKEISDNEADEIIKMLIDKKIIDCNKETILYKKIKNK
jgi:hypothetical protein